MLFFLIGCFFWLNLTKQLKHIVNELNTYENFNWN